jgi:hypothetical protein
MLSAVEVGADEGRGRFDISFDPKQTFSVYG